MEKGLRQLAQGKHLVNQGRGRSAVLLWREGILWLSGVATNDADFYFSIDSSEGSLGLLREGGAELAVLTEES